MTSQTPSTSSTNLVPRSSSPSSSPSSALVPSQSLSGQNVLSESSYTSTLSKLIQRDFFPNLSRLEAENKYLDALQGVEEEGGEERLERAVRKLVNLEVRDGIVPPTPATQRGRETPRTMASGTPRWEDVTPRTVRRVGEWDPTPVRRRNELEEEGEQEDGDEEDAKDEIQKEGRGGERGPSIDRLSLATFQNNFTSEDNASFQQIMEAGERKRREAFAWAYKAEEVANGKRQKALAYSEDEARRGFKASWEQAPEDVKRGQIAGGDRQTRLLTAEGEKGDDKVPLVGSEHNKRQKRVGLAETSPSVEISKPLNSWSHRARNALFYPPDADRSTVYQRTSSLPIDSKLTKETSSIFVTGAEEGDKRPSVNFGNTRLQEQEEEDTGRVERRPGSETPRSSRIEAAIGGWGETSSNAGSMASTEQVGVEVPAGYNFVSPLPSPKPGDLEEERIRQLMTWGMVVGTPRAVRDPSSTVDESPRYDGSFKIPPTPSRDLLARQLADKSSRSSSTNRTPLPKSSTIGSKRKVADLSPAAKTLLNKTGFSSRSSGFATGAGGSSIRERPTSTRRSSLRGKLTGLPKEEVVDYGRLQQRWTPSPSPRQSK